MDFRRRKEIRSFLDMTPLIDCVLQLLIFFMLSSTFASPKIEIALPKASASDGTTESDATVILAGGSGEIYINHERVDIDSLRARLEAILAAKEDRRVTFRGHEEIPYRIFVRVVDAARLAGAEILNIAHTRNRDGDGRAGAEGGGNGDGERESDGR